MTAPVGRYHVVSDAKGRILALVPARAARMAGGVELGWRPVAGRGQRVSEVELTKEHAALAPQDLLAGYSVKVDRKTGRAQLARRKR
jgi:hypothetical protein